MSFNISHGYVVCFGFTVTVFAYIYVIVSKLFSEFALNCYPNWLYVLWFSYPSVNLCSDLLRSDIVSLLVLWISAAVEFMCEPSSSGCLSLWPIIEMSSSSSMSLSCCSGLYRSCCFFFNHGCRRLSSR